MSSPIISGEVDQILVDQYFEAIQEGNSDKIRELLEKDRRLTKVKRRGDYRFDPTFELDAYKFLGAYIGQVTGLHLSILLGLEPIARDIADMTFDQDLNKTFGDNNTTLHLAAFMELKEVVKVLVDRGTDTQTKNGKGFTPLDVSSDEQVIAILFKN